MCMPKIVNTKVFAMHITSSTQNSSHKNKHDFNLHEYTKLCPKTDPNFWAFEKSNESHMNNKTIFF